MPSPQFENLVTMFKAQRSAETPGVHELRAGFDLLGQMMPPVEGIEMTDTPIGGMPGVRFSGADADTDRVILYLHGGGYAIGTRTSHTPVASTLAKAARLPVLLPEYRLAPEHPFPAAVEDARAAYEWVLDQGFAPGRVALAGESAGGGLLIALQVALRDAGRPLPAASAALSPWCDLTGLGEVTDEALDVDFLRPEAIESFTEYYVPAGDRSDPLCSPLYADLTGLPPMLVHAGECEILCDMGRRLASRAKDAGVDVTLEVEPGMFHAWQLFAGGLPEANEAIDRIAKFLRDHLS